MSVRTPEVFWKLRCSPPRGHPHSIISCDQPQHGKSTRPGCAVPYPTGRRL